MGNGDAVQPEAVPRVSGAALALSGGGYRAMMFHVGILWRLNEIGLLGRLKRISSVSGGSIAAACLGLLWADLCFVDGRAESFDLFVDKMREMAMTTVDVGAVLGGVLLPGDISHRVAKAYDEVLFNGATLQSLPDDSKNDAPRIVLNATNIQTASLMRFSRAYIADWRVGRIVAPTVSLATAVAASSAFPPILSPLTLAFTQPVEDMAGTDLHRAPFTSGAVLSDGGVYDNLGLETIKHFTIQLVSDAGQKIGPEERPHHDWARHALRVLDTVDNQVRSLRKRQLIQSYVRGDAAGCYWGIRSDPRNYPSVSDPLGAETRDPARLAAIPTRLSKMPRSDQDGLINWGYAICDRALRSHGAAALYTLGVTAPPPQAFPVDGGY